MSITQSHPIRDVPTAPGRVRDVVRRHPLAAFFVLAFLGSWTAWTPYVLSQNGLGLLGLTFPGGPAYGQLLGVLPGAYLGPIGAAVLVTALADGRAGLRTWRGRLLRWRVGWRWYAAVLVAVPAVMVLSTMALGHTPVRPPTLVLLSLVPGLLLQLVTTGLAEEPGWRDFALPRLQHRFGPLGAAAVLGPAWGAWHLPLFLTQWGGWPDVTWRDPAAFLAFTVAFNVVMTWVFNRSGQSLPLSMVLHVSVNNFASMAWLSVFPGISGAELQQANLLWAGTAAAVLLVATRGRLGYVRG